jgi:tetratricopeptide (TPR) repeat protein/Tol biopolymer transport system component
MHKGLVLGIVGTAVAISAAGMVYWGGSYGMRRISRRSAGVETAGSLARIDLLSPYDRAVFPPESVAPSFTWSTDAVGVETWEIRVSFESGAPIVAHVARPEWTPNANNWKIIKQRSSVQPARVSVIGIAASPSGKKLAEGAITIFSSTDPVAAPIFYREVILPFIEAVKDPAEIRWRFGTIDSPNRPPVVLENLPVCGNCHSFSSDGKVLGMDVDYANDKGSYVMTDTAPEMVLGKDKVISWSQFRKADKQPTFGLLSQVSPDGRYAVSTVKDRSVFVARPDLAFSQLFFPLKGILAIYDRLTNTFSALPGADDPAFVHSNPTWSPDGQFIVFARARAYNLKYIKETGAALLTAEECREFLSEGKTFRYDLYRIAFNGGKGGVAIPIQGASDNGRSNFFPKYSPDGKWIVYTQANSFMLLQPDSALHIIPAAGGQARRLECNTDRMNSWHSFSPNGKWLVFASKANSPYTQLFLSHIDEQGSSTPPILLSQFTGADRAANIPEFVNLAPGAITSIMANFVDDVSYMRTAEENVKAGDPEAAERLYRKALAVNSKNAEAQSFLGGLLTDRGQLQEAHQHLDAAIRLNPKDATAYYNLGNALTKERRYAEAIRNWKKSLEIDGKNVNARMNLGAVLLELGKAADAEKSVKAALALEPSNAQAHNLLGKILSRLERQDEARREWREAIRLDGLLVEAHESLGTMALQAGELELAVQHLTQALKAAPGSLSCLMSLATAYGLKGDIQRAKQLTERGADVARATGQKELELELRARLKSFSGG